MDATRIIAIRHGETAWNVDSRLQGHLDIPLNDVGLWQARQAALALPFPEPAQLNFFLCAARPSNPSPNRNSVPGTGTPGPGGSVITGGLLT